MKPIKQLALRDRPREKLREKGAASLSDLELLAVILGRGSKGHPLGEVAVRVLAWVDGGGDQSEFSKLRAIPGMGPAKAALLCAAMEFVRRRVRPAGIKIGKPIDVLPMIRHFADRKQEYFLCTTLNGAHEVMVTRVITVGLVNQSQVHPREVFADAITDRAAAVIVAHNHPSGSTLPSASDKAVTERLQSAAEILGIRLLDHIIFSLDTHFSFVENGML